MQNAKDSFFSALRDRLAVVNPERTVIIDGQTRPGILVCENELAGLDEKLSDLFCVSWGASQRIVPDRGPTTIECTVSYKSAGSAEQNGIDRGRMLTKMDDELEQILDPRCTAKMNFQDADQVPSGGNVFWSTAELAAIGDNGRYLNRAATLRIFFYPEVK